MRMLPLTLENRSMKRIKWNNLLDAQVVVAIILSFASCSSSGCEFVFVNLAS